MNDVNGQELAITLLPSLAYAYIPLKTELDVVGNLSLERVNGMLLNDFERRKT